MAERITRRRFTHWVRAWVRGGAVVAGSLACGPIACSEQPVSDGEAPDPVTGTIAAPLVSLLPHSAPQPPPTPVPRSGAAASAGAFVPNQVLVKFEGSVAVTEVPERLQREARRRGGRFLRRLEGRSRGLQMQRVGVVQLGPKETVEQALLEYRALPGVEYAEPNYLYQATEIPSDNLFWAMWGLHNTNQAVPWRGPLPGRVDSDIDYPEAWDLANAAGSFVAEPIVVAISDTGIQYDHPDLAPVMWVNPGEIPANGIDDDGNGRIDDVHGWDAINQDGDPYDDHYHGTHVAGTVAAATNNGFGVAGVARNVRLMGVKLLAASGSGDAASIAEAIAYAAANGATVINASWGGPGRSSTIENAINDAIAAGVTFVAAAGNDGVDNDAFPHYPGGYANPGIISVANTDSRDRLVEHSNWGKLNVDLSAPGEIIASTYPGNGYVYLTGTSMATPHVAGAVASLFSLGLASNTNEAKALLLDSVEPVPSLGCRTLSGGRLNLHNLFQRALGTDVTAPGAVSDLAVFATGPDFAVLEFTAPGSDGAAGGSVRAYEVRYAPTAVFTDFDAATPHCGAFRPGAPGQAERLTVEGLLPDTDYTFQVRAVDFGGNVSLSNLGQGTSTSADPVVLENSENLDGTILWTTSSNTPSRQWVLLTGTAEEGRVVANSWPPPYPNNLDNAFTSPAIDLTGAGRATLQFDQTYDIEPFYDRGYVEVSSNGGTSWTQLYSISGYRPYPSWERVTLPLDSLLGSADVRVRFRFVSDATSPAGATFAGWFLDNIRIESGPALPFDVTLFGDAFANAGQWVLSAPWGVSGGALSDSPSGTYPNSTQASAGLATPLDLREVTRAELQFELSHAFYQYSTSQNDFLILEVSTDGSLWAELQRWTGVSALHRERIDLSAYAGASALHLRFLLVSDGANVDAGASIRNMQVLGVQASSTCTSAAQCDDEVDCTLDSCDADGVCAHTPDAAACDDDDPCTVDACGPEGCTGTPVTCPQGQSCLPETGQCQGPIFRDVFSSGLASWTESGEPDWNTENLFSSSGYPATGSGSPAAHADNCDTQCVLTMAQPLDLTQYASASLSFLRFVGSALDTNEYLRVSVFNGTAWVRVFDWTVTTGGPVYDDNTWRAESLDLAPYLGVQDFRVRFETRQSETNEHVHVDDVVISATSPLPGCGGDADCDDGDACTVGTCNAGECEQVALGCNDGNACTSDACDPNQGCVHSAVACDDGSACTDDSCDPVGGCRHVGVPCAPPDACSAASCDPLLGCVVTELGCDDGNACTEDACDPATGCTTVATDCDDANVCTADSCDPATGCAHVALGCSDGDACTVDACHPVTGCASTELDCDDGSACTVETCDAALGCVSSPLGCDDGNACTVDACDPVTGCASTQLDCDDGNACTVETCDGALGCVSSPLECDDGNACTVDACDPVTGCSHGPLGCNDGNACTQDACEPASGCTFSATSCADDGNLCTAEICDPATGCGAVPMVCNDGNACTVEACDPATGGCVSSALGCDDGNVCTTDACDPVLGCVHAAVSCDDGNACTVDACGAAGCSHTAVVCPGGGSCNATTGQCPATQQTVTFRQGASGYTGARDTFLTQSAPSTARGTLASLEWDNDDPSGSGSFNYALLAFGQLFASQGGPIPDGSDIVSATLSVTVYGSGNPGQLREVRVPWAENVTFQTFGGSSGVQSTEMSDTVGTAPGTVGTHTIDVTASLLRWSLAPASNQGWIVAPSGTDGVDARSREYSTVTQRPLLSVTFVPPSGCSSDAECDDGDACTNDTCEAGSCSQVAMVCDDADACTVDACNPTSGLCQVEPVSCDDGNACTTDTCGQSGCTNVASTCPGGGSCNPATGQCQQTEVTVSFRQGASGYAAARDTFLTQSAPSTARGTLASLEWDSDDPSGSGSFNHALLAFGQLFSSQGGPIPDGAPIVSATLELTVFGSGNSGQLREVLVAWAENVTHQTFGGSAGVQAGELGNLIATVPGTVATHSVNVTASLAAWSANPASNQGWIVVPAGTDGVDVRSREATTTSQRPRLTVTYLGP